MNHWKWACLIAVGASQGLGFCPDRLPAATSIVCGGRGPNGTFGFRLARPEAAAPYLKRRAALAGAGATIVDKKAALEAVFWILSIRN